MGCQPRPDVRPTRLHRRHLKSLPWVQSSPGLQEEGPGFNQDLSPHERRRPKEALDVHQGDQERSQCYYDPVTLQIVPSEEAVLDLEVGYHEMLGQRDDQVA